MLSFKIFFQNRKFFAPAFLYSCFSLIFSTWVTYIPFIAEKLNITDGKIGSALFFTSLGSLSMLPISNRMVDRLGVGRQVFIGFIMYSTAIYGMFLAPTYAVLCAALYGFGISSSVFAISLNCLTATIEKRAGKNIMTGSHGFWSMGGFIGSATGSFIAGLLKMPVLHISILIGILISLQLWLRKEYFTIRSDTFVKEKHSKFPLRPLLAIASISLTDGIRRYTADRVNVPKKVGYEGSFWTWLCFVLDWDDPGAVWGDALGHRFGSVNCPGYWNRSGRLHTGIAETAFDHPDRIFHYRDRLFDYSPRGLPAGFKDKGYKNSRWCFFHICHGECRIPHRACFTGFYSRAQNASTELPGIDGICCHSVYPFIEEEIEYSTVFFIAAEITTIFNGAKRSLASADGNDA
jgi:hypothetical protein